MIDSTVSGRSEGAVQRTFTLMVGGRADDVERAMPFLGAIGKWIAHALGHGAGQMVKFTDKIFANGLAGSETPRGQKFEAVVTRISIRDEFADTKPARELGAMPEALPQILARSARLLHQRLP